MPASVPRQSVRATCGPHPPRGTSREESHQERPLLRTALVAIMLVAQQPWVHVGSRVVGSGGERDIIRTAGEGRFRHIRLLVEGGDLELFDISITFADGKTFSPAGRFSFTGNLRSRVIAMPSGARVSRWIYLFFIRLQGGDTGK